MMCTFLCLAYKTVDHNKETAVLVISIPDKNGLMRTCYRRKMTFFVVLCIVGLLHVFTKPTELASSTEYTQMEFLNNTHGFQMNAFCYSRKGSNTGCLKKELHNAVYVLCINIQRTYTTF
jgi:hypothetical protein